MSYDLNSNNYIERGVYIMNEFKLKSDKKETENKTIRFPLPLIEEINEVIKNEDVSFSGFVIQACEYALQNIKKNEK